jgi:hypothetical protein
MIDSFLHELCHLNLEEFLRDFQFSGLFFAIFAAVALKLVLLIFSKKLQLQFTFWCD